MNVNKKTSIALIALMIFMISNQHPDAGYSLRNISGFVFLAMIASALYDQFKKQKERQVITVAVDNTEVTPPALREMSFTRKAVNNVIWIIGGIVALSVLGTIIGLEQRHNTISGASQHNAGLGAAQGYSPMGIETSIRSIERQVTQGAGINPTQVKFRSVTLHQNAPGAGGRYVICGEISAVDSSGRFSPYEGFIQIDGGPLTMEGTDPAFFATEIKVECQ